MDLSLWLFVAVKRLWSREHRLTRSRGGGSSWGSHVAKFPIISAISGNEFAIQELYQFVELVSAIETAFTGSKLRKGRRGHTVRSVTKVKSNTAKERGAETNGKVTTPTGCAAAFVVPGLDHLPVTK